MRTYDDYLKKASVKFNLPANKIDEVIKSVGEYMYKVRKACDHTSHYGATLNIMYLGKLIFRKKFSKKYYQHNGESEIESKIRYCLRLNYLLEGNMKNMPKITENYLYDKFISDYDYSNMKFDEINKISAKIVKLYSGE